ncbi:helix-turn-helix transcriptional regulator [Nocardiopsis sp. RSe5-2]|uniref:Helix-turn-helix transcriptional regulator n=2 Tax=Nocardiopsis endophytica TaxID=3018445 RepID=A0ABT4U1P2_9ACTN|nr:helix-turn-helix transcriptional regulator [Nocardiopsis endophytica]MDA2810395.1 helix-turn-helix transcriptional regulator [Nocardiopsis endophytica]
MPQKPDPLWARWGAELALLRSRAGMTQTDLGRRALLSKSAISSFELGTRTPKVHHAEKLDNALSTDGTLVRLWRNLHKQRQVPDWFLDALMLERSSREIRQYQSILVPGLLQTPDYARTLIRLREPQATDEHVAQLVKGRIGRLPEITPRKPLLWFVVDEIVIKRVVGTPKTMAEQARHIASLVDDGTIRFQVLRETGLHPGICAPFRIMTLHESKAVLCQEKAIGDEVVDDPVKVNKIATLFGAMQAEALSVGESLALLREQQKEFEQ